jgi:type IV secretion system protein VirB10
MTLNMSPATAGGSIGKSKQRLALAALLIAAVFVVGFILQTTDKKKKQAGANLGAAGTSSTITPAGQGAVSAYSANLTQSVSNYQQNAQQQAAAAPQGQAVASAYPQGGAPSNGAPYSASKPAPYGSNGGQATIPSTAYSQPGYAPPQQLPLPRGAAIKRSADKADIRDDMAQQNEKRRYEARYGSSVAQSKRTDSRLPASGYAAAPAASMAAPGSALPAGYAAMLAKLLPAAKNDTTAEEHTAAATTKSKHPERRPGTFMVPEGTTIDTVLQTRLNGSFAGPAKVMVTNPVYDRARQIVLIPAGTILLGDVRAVQKVGEDRLAVTFHRMLRTDGFNADLDTFTGLDQIGETALKDKVNHHYVEVFGVSVALGAIAGLAEMSSGGSSYGSESGQSMYMQGFGQSLDMSAQRILDKYTNILPTVTIREGTRVKVYLTNDIYLPPAVAKPILD